MPSIPTGGIPSLTSLGGIIGTGAGSKKPARPQTTNRPRPKPSKPSGKGGKKR